jgi:TPR repeat protein
LCVVDGGTICHLAPSAAAELVEKDYKKAAELVEKAAEQGYVEAQYNLACAYHKGTGVTKDTKKAVEWWTKAAEQGHEDARCKLEAFAKMESEQQAESNRLAFVAELLEEEETKLGDKQEK